MKRGIDLLEGWIETVPRRSLGRHARGLLEFDQTDGFDPTDPEPVPEFEFDQSLPDLEH